MTMITARISANMAPMVPSDRPDEVPLPIELGPIANGEYEPFTPGDVAGEAERRLRRLTDETAPRLGMSRREFLRSSCGTAAALFLLAACHSESSKSSGRPAGGTFNVPTSTTTD